MRNRLFLLVFLPLIFSYTATADSRITDPTRDILVTFDNSGARAFGIGASAPYQNRKRYSLSAQARQHARAVAAEYALAEIDHWPIRSLSVYCFVYRIPEGSNRKAAIERLNVDHRVESVQPLQEFETGINDVDEYDDTYVGLQHGLVSLDIIEAHRYSRGDGVRVAMIDSQADTDHEDLKGRVSNIEDFAGRERTPDNEHGTAVASLIAANANNARGIVGVAPEAKMEIFVSCWAEAGFDGAVCDSFTLAKALDTMLDHPPQVLNLSLRGPPDPLVERLLIKAFRAGVIIVAASSANLNSEKNFPANLDQVIGVGSSTSGPGLSVKPGEENQTSVPIFAPGNEILVAMPDNAYDFRSGSSLATAQVSGVVALLLAVAPDMPFDSVKSLLYESQHVDHDPFTTVNACVVLQLADRSRSCSARVAASGR